MPEDWLRERIFSLCYAVHGGSGLNFRPTDVEEMTLEDIDWYVRRLGKQREDEQRQLERAQRRPGR